MANGRISSRDGRSPRRAGPSRIVGAVAIPVIVLIAIAVLDCVQYLHWRMPAFASHTVSNAAGVTVERARGPLYEAVGLHTDHDRYMAVAAAWKADTDCIRDPGKVLRATRTAVFKRHSVAELGYDDGIEGVWVMNCVPDDDGALTVYAAAMERDGNGTHPDPVSPERVVLAARGDGYAMRAYDDATDKGRSFHLSEENGGFPFPRYVIVMQSTMKPIPD